MSDYSQLERQFQILKILNNYPEGLDIKQLHRQLSMYGCNASERTIRRDMQLLSKCFNIKGNDTRPEVFALLGMNLENIRMDIKELQAIKFIQELIKPYNHLEDGINAENLLHKLLASLPEDQKGWLGNASSLIQVNMNNLINEKDYNPELKYIIQNAIISCRCLKIKYHSFHSNTKSIRIIEPYHLEINEGCYHLWAYCQERHAIRDFRLSRIIWAELCTDTFTPRQQLIDKSLNRKKRFKSMCGQIAVLVKLRFNKTAARLIKEYHGKRADKLIECDDGTVIFERVTAITPDLKQWVLSFGADVKVLEPEDLKEEIRDIAMRMARNYEE